MVKSSDKKKSLFHPCLSCTADFRPTTRTTGQVVTMKTAARETRSQPIDGLADMTNPETGKSNYLVALVNMAKF